MSLPDFVDKAMVAYLACRQLPAGFAHLSVLTAATMYWPHHPNGEWGRVSVPARLLYFRWILAMTPTGPFVRKPKPRLDLNAYRVQMRPAEGCHLAKRPMITLAK